MFEKLKSIRVQLPKRLQLGLSKERREEGVTLIELLAVVVILGIISAVAVPVVSGAINNAKVNATLNSEGTVQVALQRYYDQMGYYPKNLNVLTEKYSTTTGLQSSSGNAGPYLSNQFPEVDGFGHKFFYRAVGSTASGAPGASGYMLVSGDGLSLSTALGGKTTSLVNGTSYIYAGGGVDVGGSPVGSSPELTSKAPTNTSKATWVDN